MIPQILSLGTMLTQLGTYFKSTKELADDAREYVDAATSAYNVLNTGSVSQSASRTLIAPMVAIEDALLHAEYMGDLMTVINLRDIRDTLGHLSLQGKVNGISIGSLVDSINPRRAGLLSLAGAESFGGGSVSGMEAAKPEGKPGSDKVTINGKTYSDLNEYTPLAVGRTVEASVTIDGTTLNFPLTFRQVPVPVSSNDLLTIFEAARPEDGMYARFMMWRAGELTTPEFLMGTDQIKKEFNIRRDDLSGYYKESQERNVENKKAAMRTGVMSMNTMANTIIMSADTARNIELELGVSFDSRGISKIRKAVLANTIVVVNDATGVFTFYYSGSSMPETYTRREITTTSKKDTSMDLGSLMKLFGGR